MFYKVTLGFTTGATYNMTNVHVFKAAQARRAYFLKNLAKLYVGVPPPVGWRPLWGILDGSAPRGEMVDFVGRRWFSSE